MTGQQNKSSLHRYKNAFLDMVEDDIVEQPYDLDNGIKGSKLKTRQSLRDQRLAGVAKENKAICAQTPNKAIGTFWDRQSGPQILRKSENCALYFLRPAITVRVGVRPNNKYIDTEQKISKTYNPRAHGYQYSIAPREWKDTEAARLYKRNTGPSGTNDKDTNNAITLKRAAIAKRKRDLEIEFLMDRKYVSRTEATRMWEEMMVGKKDPNAIPPPAARRPPSGIKPRGKKQPTSNLGRQDLYDEQENAALTPFQQKLKKRNEIQAVHTEDAVKTFKQLSSDISGIKLRYAQGGQHPTEQSVRRRYAGVLAKQTKMIKFNEQFQASIPNEIQSAQGDPINLKLINEYLQLKTRMIGMNVETIEKHLKFIRFVFKNILKVPIDGGDISPPPQVHYDHSPSPTRTPNAHAKGHEEMNTVDKSLEAIEKALNEHDAAETLRGKENDRLHEFQAETNKILNNPKTTQQKINGIINKMQKHFIKLQQKKTMLEKEVPVHTDKDIQNTMRDTHNIYRAINEKEIYIFKDILRKLSDFTPVQPPAKSPAKPPAVKRKKRQTEEEKLGNFFPLKPKLSELHKKF